MSGTAEIWEFGAGSGALALQLLGTLGTRVERYTIVDLSGSLRQRQRDRLAAHAGKVRWLSELPARMRGVVIGNEVLDAMPAHLISVRPDSIDERGVAMSGDSFVWRSRPAAGVLLETARGLHLAPGYDTEINLAAQSFVRTLAARMERGVVLLIDYGFPAREFYHPQRSEGTLMCHYRQHAHDDPFCLVGLQDVTAHVDFSAIAAAARDSGLDLLGYASQAQFLINCGITDVLAATPPANAAAYLPLATQVQKLTSPAEMGELFKVIAFGKNHRAPLAGFACGNKQGLL